MQTKSSTEEKMLKRYHKVLGKQAAIAMNAKAHLGDLPGCAPLGYLNTRRNGKPVVEIDSVAASLIQEAFNLAAEGTLSIRKILAVLTSKGLVSRNNKVLGASAMQVILVNPFYIGKLRYGAELLQGNHDPIISEEVFDQVQESLAKRRKR